MITPYYKDESIQIFCGDMLEVISQIDGTFDAIVTDPPYSITSLKWDRWPENWPQYLLDRSRQLWCFGSMRMFLDRIQEFHGWQFAQDIIWEKHNGSSAQHDRFRRIHEIALHFYQGEWKSLFISPQFTNEANRKRIHRKQKPQHWGQIGSSLYESHAGGPKLQTSVIYARSCHGHAVNETQKPEQIVEPLVSYSVPPGGIVLDPFAGSGTTLVVAKRLGMRAIGIEMREEQCEAIVDRLRVRTLPGLLAAD